MVEKIAFIGAGSMAEAIIAGIVNEKFINNKDVWVTNKDNSERLTELETNYGVTTSQNKSDILTGADIVVLSTKPYDVDIAIQSIKPYLTEKQLLISVIAGVSTDQIVKVSEQDLAVIRAMPNTSASIGYSATAITQGQFATEDDLLVAQQLFTAIGTVNVVDEDDMHIVTGISGSGPAYIYYLVEAMEEAAVKEGLDPRTAKELITQTIIGAGNMLATSKQPVHILRENVTSPNGTTAAGLKALADHHFSEAVIACVQSATKRSKELGESK